MSQTLPSDPISKGFRKAQAKANKFAAPVVLSLTYKDRPGVGLLRTYSPARQAQIRAGSANEYIIEPEAA